MVELSIVIPVYNAEGCLAELHRRLTSVLVGLGVSYELVFVEDVGSDRSWEVLVELAKKDTAIKAFRLSRNFGQHAAITAGLTQAQGNYAVVMDCDLQDPPEGIPRLYATAKSGYDVVLGRRLQRKQSPLRRFVGRLYFRLMGWFCSSRFEAELGTFSIISRPVIESFLRFEDLERHYLFILRWMGFRTTYIEYEHGERFAGDSSYTLRTLIAIAADGLFFQTTSLLRWIVYMGFGLAGTGAALALYVIYIYFTASVLPGWSSLIIINLLIGGFITISSGIVGLYVGKIFEQVKHRPLFLIDQKVVDGREGRATGLITEGMPGG